MARVSVRGLTKRYGRTEAIADVGFDVAGGEILGLLGPNGAGKTTTIESVAGLIELDAGQVMIGGIDARRHPRAAKALIGTALQSTRLQGQITPFEALRLFGSLYRRSIAPAVLLDRFGLTDQADAAYDTLSGGLQQRLALALAFVNDPEVVILDEPTTGLDAAMRRDLHASITDMKREGVAILLATHDLAEAERLCDRICVIDHGRIVAAGSPAALVGGSRSGVRLRATTDKTVDVGSLERLTGIDHIVVDGTNLSLTTSDLTRTLAEVAALCASRQVAIRDMRAGEATLEDFILSLTARPVTA